MRTSLLSITISLATCWMCFTASAQFNLVTYAGNEGKETFYDAVQISDGTFLVCGYAENLDWVDASVPRTELALSGNIPNGLGTDRYGFILQLSSDLSQLMQVVHFPQGAVEDVRFMKFSSLPYQTTGNLFISCNTSDTSDNDGGYILAKLNGNFIDQVPNTLVWHRVVWAMGYAKEDVMRVTRLIDRNEYKRRQSPIGVRITQRGFGKDRRYPITSKFVLNG